MGLSNSIKSNIDYKRIFYANKAIKNNDKKKKLFFQNISKKKKKKKILFLWCIKKLYI